MSETLVTLGSPMGADIIYSPQLHPLQLLAVYVAWQRQSTLGE